MANFSIIRGTTKQLNIQLVDDDDNAIDLTDATCILAVGPDLDTPTDDLALTVSLTIVGDPTNGQLTYTFAPSETSDIDAGMYEAEVRADYVDGTLRKSEAPFLFTIVDPVEAPA